MARHGARDPEGRELARLILGERLGGEEEQRARLRVARGLGERGELVAEALAARRARGHDHVLAGLQQVVGGALVAVQGRDAGRRERVAQGGRQLVRQRLRGAGARRLVRHGHDLVVAALAEQRAQAAVRVHAHALMVPPAYAERAPCGALRLKVSEEASRCAGRRPW